MANPVISALSFSASDSTIVGSWTTDISSDSNMTAGGKAAVDNGYQTAVTTHICIVTGLLPSQPYSCIVTSGATSSTPQTITTSAQHLSQPIQRATVLSFSQAPNHGDDNPTFVSNDDVTYILEDDGFGFVAGPTPNAGANMQICKLTTESTLVGPLVNLWTAYGGAGGGGSNGTDGPGGAALSNKTTGLIGFSGDLYAFQSRSYNPAAGHPLVQQYFGNIMRSTDKGVTWNSWQDPSTYNSAGIPPNPLGSFQFDSGNIGAVMPIRYAKDDGTIGYLTAGNRFDGGDGYIYMNFVDTFLQNADALYLMRMPRYAVQSQDATKVQYWKGPASPSQLAFVTDSNWAAGYTGLTAILSDTGRICWSDTIFIPTLNRYLLLRWYYPVVGTSGVQSNTTRWAFMEGPTPAGPWTAIYNNTFYPSGLDTPYAFHRSAAENVAIVDIPFKLVCSGDYASSGGLAVYKPTLTAVTLNLTASSGMIQLVQDDFIRANENPLANGNWTTTNSCSALQIVSNLCESSALAVNCNGYWTGAGAVSADGNWPKDHYSEMTVGPFTDDVVALFYVPRVRQSTSANTCYQLNVGRATAGGGSTQTLYRTTAGSSVSIGTWSRTDGGWRCYPRLRQLALPYPCW